MRTAPDMMYAIMKTISHDEIKEKLVRHHNLGESPRDQTMTVVHSDADTSPEHSDAPEPPTPPEE